MKRKLWIVILLAGLVALGLFGQRWLVEKPNRKVEIVYDLPGLLELSEKQGLPLESLLGDLKHRGITQIAVQPENLGEWLLAGKEIPSSIKAELPSEISELDKFLTLPVAFDQEHFVLVEQGGLQAVPKLNTAPWPVEPLWQDSQPELIIVSGSGFFDLNQLGNSQARIAPAEFSEPKLDLAKTQSVVRLHGISAREMDVLSDERILNRYLRAVKERNIRVVYMRPFRTTSDSWERSLKLVTDLQARLEGAGFQIASAEPFAMWQPNRVWTSLVAVGIWAAAILYGGQLFPRFTKLFVVGGILGWLGSVFLLFSKPILAQQILALGAAVIFPCLALEFVWGNKPWQRYLGAAGVSLLGALFVVGTLTGSEFLVKLEGFRGVKFMHVLPIALVFFTLVRPLKPWLDKDIPIRYLLFAGFAGLAGVLYILRTGNFGLPVLGFEIKAREFLENFLVVRPRTKEFLLGHPALYLSLQSKNYKKSWLLPIAVIGQISLVNTFTHTHTLLKISLLRTFYGLLFGYIIGWVIYRVYQWGREKFDHDRNLRLLRLR